MMQLEQEVLLVAGMQENSSGYEYAAGLTAWG